MKDYIEERALEIANYIIETKSTVRDAAKVYKVFKSTVHTVLSIGVGFIGCSIFCRKSRHLKTHIKMVMM